MNFYLNINYLDGFLSGSQDSQSGGLSSRLRNYLFRVFNGAYFNPNYTLLNLFLIYLRIIKEHYLVSGRFEVLLNPKRAFMILN